MLYLALCALLLATGVANEAPENLVANPSLEEVADGMPLGWTLEPGGATFAIQTDGGHNGANYGRFEDAAADASAFLLSKRVPARVGGTYRASAWFRTADAINPGIYLNFYDDSGARIHNVYTRAPGPTDGWVQVEVTGVAPEEAVEVCVGLYAYLGDIGTFDADDVTMTVEGGGEPGQGTIPRAMPGGKTVADIGSRLELFVDSFLIDSLTGDAVRRLHHPQPREIALEFNRPWEGPFCGYVALINDGGKFRMYYRGWAKLDGPDFTCMVESEDGVTWTRPNVGLFEFEGSKDNNIVWAGPGCHNFTPFLDTNPACKPEERYKALASAGPRGSLCAFVSPDGVNWKMLREEPVITEGAFDSQNIAFFDPLRGEYVEFHRGFRDGVRDIMTSTSPDFVNWTKPQWLAYGDAPKQHLYTNAITPYFRAPHIYLGFPCRFVPERKKIQEHAEGGVNDGVLMSSRDGLNFERWLEAFLRPGLDPLRWTDRNNYITWGLAPTSPEEISLYWTEHYRYPTYRLRRGTIRTDGFVSVHAGRAGGEVLTRPLTFTGKRLVVNCSTSAVGSARFELCDEAGNPYAGFSAVESEVFFGDEIAHEAKWRDSPDVSVLAGKPVRLRVRLKDADLYSIQFAP
jgi:hypothetical protein